MKKAEEEGVKAEEVSVKFSGEALKRVMDIKHQVEEETGRPVSIAEVVRRIIKEAKRI